MCRWLKFSSKRGSSVSHLFKAVPLVLATILLTVACGRGAASQPTEANPKDLGQIRTFDVPSRKHVTGHVTYQQVPPVGGDHSPNVQPCGFYAKPITTERGVHTMEHGAVWITYRPSLPRQEVEILKGLTRTQHYLLVSPWAHRLPAPVVASAWGHQVMLASASDPALASFITTYASAPGAPEPHAYC